jgi:mRNA interferase RelE/StbE
MIYNITFSKKARRQIKSLDKQIRLRMEDDIRSKLLINPEFYLESLLGKMIKYYKFRVGDYRLICSKKDDKITVVELGHRKEIYKEK